MSLDSLGLNSFFEEQIKQLGLSDFDIARVMSESRGAYKVKNLSGEYLAKVTGKQMFEANSREDYPAVGDWVVINKVDNENVVIKKILDRQTIIKRKTGDKNRTGNKSDVQVIATNIDFAFVVESIDRDFSLNRFERYFAIAENGGVKSVVVINKIDLISKEELDEKIKLLKERFPKTDIILTSIVDDSGLDELKKYIQEGKTYCFLGSSGVGKSSLINKLLKENTIKTGDISDYSLRGKHTTTNRQMYFLDNGGIVIDNPGVREVGLIDSNENVSSFFDEMTYYSKNCKYTDCTHTQEPDCAVIEAVEKGELDREKYNNYLNLKKETEYNDMSSFEKREKDKKFGKFIKKTKKELEDFWG